MRKLVVFNRVSVDGFYAGTNGEIDWFLHKGEVDHVGHQLMQPDTLLMGRQTYEMFYNYWPQAAAAPDASDHTRQTYRELEGMHKFVFSRTLQSADWRNTTLVSQNLVETVRGLKLADGGDITIFGSGTVIHQLAAADLIDEYILIITPVVLGEGKPLFQPNGRRTLNLQATHAFPTGNVILHYA